MWTKRLNIDADPGQKDYHTHLDYYIIGASIDIKTRCLHRLDGPAREFNSPHNIFNENRWFIAGIELTRIYRHV